MLVEVRKGIYGLPQAGLLAQQRLIKHLATHGYYQCAKTACLFRHETRDIAFTLIVDDFGIKHKGSGNLAHLLSALTELYEITVDEEGKKYSGITIDIDRRKRTVSLSMPGYIDKYLTRFGRMNSKGARSPSIYMPPKYGQKEQVADVDSSDKLSEEKKKKIQEELGVLLYYARAVDPTILQALNAISSEQATPTEKVQKNMDRLGDYVSRYKNNKTVYKASKMDLILSSDAAYLNKSKARSTAGMHQFLGDKNKPTENNGPLHTYCQIIDRVVASASEAEYAALFMATKHAVASRNTLEDLGYPQSPTRTFCDNACAVGIANDNVKLKRTKHIDMNYHWVRDRIRLGEFVVEWQAGKHNRADFFTKSLSVHKHQTEMINLVNVPKVKMAWQDPRPSQNERNNNK